MKPYNKIPIIECGEPLLPIPLENFIAQQPSAYEKLGADYQGKSAYYLRESVIEALLKAAQELDKRKKGWKIEIFDAYRPVAIQKFMVDYTFAQICQEKKIDVNKLTSKDRQNVYEEVYTIWAIPSNNPKSPPPHSTGGAVDITLVDHYGEAIDMGGEIDELSPRSNPNYYCDSLSNEKQKYHERRELLNDIMTSVGFCRHLGEWWHFCLGDQMWAWLSNQKMAKYGKI